MINWKIKFNFYILSCYVNERSNAIVAVKMIPKLTLLYASYQAYRNLMLSCIEPSVSRHSYPGSRNPLLKWSASALFGNQMLSRVSNSWCTNGLSLTLRGLKWVTVDAQVTSVIFIAWKKVRSVLNSTFSHFIWTFFVICLKEGWYSIFGTITE